MFNLKQSIADWRRQMFVAGIQSSGSLDELEGHLREEISRQIKLGNGEAEAFEISVRQVGHPEILKREFRKNEGLSSRKMGTAAMLAGAVVILRILIRHGEQGPVWNAESLEWLLAGAAMFIFGLGAMFINAGLGEPREVRFWKTIGIAYSLFAVWISLLPVCSILTQPKLSAVFTLADRTLIFAAITLCALSVFGWRFSRRMIPVIRSRKTRTAIGIAGCLIGPISLAMYLCFVLPQATRFSLAEFFLGWTGMAIFGGLGYGLAEAARKPTATTV